MTTKLHQVGALARPLRKSSTAARIAGLQGAFYAATGIWPLLDRRSFEAVTGPKTDWWLVQTVGTLVAAVGGALVLAAHRGRAGDQAILGAGCALGLAAIDVVHVSRGRISAVYLLDAAAELALAAAWAVTARSSRGAGRPPDESPTFVTVSLLAPPRTSRS